MVYIEDWDEFMHKATELFLADPEKTRYTSKYRDSDHHLVLKVTNDKICLKYQTHQSGDLRLVEKFNNLCFRLMSSKRLEAEVVDVASAAAAAAPGKSRRKHAKNAKD